MDGIKFEDSILDLFDTIDNVGMSNDDNDSIINQIKDQVVCKFSSLFKKKKERKKREIMFHRYKEHLESLQVLIEKQMGIINNLIDDEDAYDICDKFFKLKNELIEWSIQVYKLDLLNMSECLNKKEQKVYQYVHLYDVMEKYCSAYEKFSYKDENSQNEIKKDYKEVMSVSLQWKTYYYLVICLEKQREYNQAIISYQIKKYKKEKDNHFLEKLSRYYAADFQGQFSKNVYCKRKKMKLTQKQLQERSGVDRTMIAKIEKIRQPATLETAIKLLSSLNLGIAIYPLIECGEESLV